MQASTNLYYAISAKIGKEYIQILLRDEESAKKVSVALGTVCNDVFVNTTHPCEPLEEG